MKLLDRLVISGFIRAWLSFFVSLLLLFIVLDVFQRLDELIVALAAADRRALALALLEHYANQTVIIFDRLSGAVTLLAALFTIAWMQKSNEIIPLLASGTPVKRVLRPIIGCTLAVLALAIANRELLVPEAAERLEATSAGLSQRRLKYVTGMYDSTGILIEGTAADVRRQVVYSFSCTLPPRYAGSILHVTAREAYWIPPAGKPLTGGWLLTQTTPTELPPLAEPILTLIDPGKLFLKAERADFEALARQGRKQEYLPTWELHEELERADAVNLPAMAMELHTRLLAPFVALLALVLGLGLLLRDHARNVYRNLALCLAISVLLYFAGVAAKRLAEMEFVDPDLAAWLPVLLFGSPALVLRDAMQS